MAARSGCGSRAAHTLLRGALILNQKCACTDFVSFCSPPLPPTAQRAAAPLDRQPAVGGRHPSAGAQRVLHPAGGQCSCSGLALRGREQEWAAWLFDLVVCRAQAEPRPACLYSCPDLPSKLHPSCWPCRCISRVLPQPPPDPCLRFFCLQRDYLVLTRRAADLLTERLRQPIKPCSPTP